MADIIWSSPAFLYLEKLPQKIAFGIVRQTDHLMKFPRLGRSLEGSGLESFRQLIYRGDYRIIYEFDEIEDCVRILLIQNCRQQLPGPHDLKFENASDKGLPLE